MEKKKEKQCFTNELTYEQLREYYDTSCGCFCIDRDPNDVDIDWIRENAWQLMPIDKDKICIENK